MIEPADHNKRVVSGVIEAISSGDLTAFDELYIPRAAAKAREWVAPFLQAFPDAATDIVHADAGAVTKPSERAGSRTTAGTTNTTGGHALWDRNTSSLKTTSGRLTPA